MLNPFNSGNQNLCEVSTANILRSNSVQYISLSVGSPMPLSISDYPVVIEKSKWKFIKFNGRKLCTAWARLVERFERRTQLIWQNIDNELAPYNWFAHAFSINDSYIVLRTDSGHDVNCVWTAVVAYITIHFSYTHNEKISMLTTSSGRPRRRWRDSLALFITLSSFVCETAMGRQHRRRRRRRRRGWRLCTITWTAKKTTTIELCVQANNDDDSV